MKYEQKDNLEKAKLEINTILSRYDYNPITMLGEHVASLCNIDVGDLYTSLDKTHIAQARWLLWFAYRYATGETFDMISKRTYFCGHEFRPRAVAFGVEKMLHLIESNESWKNKWLVLKHLIKSESRENKNEQVKMTLHVPKSIKDKINIEIKHD